MKKDGIQRTAIAYNAAISACEKGLNPSKALEIFEQMKAEGVKPTVITYSALISACEKGQQWKLALEVLSEMKTEGHGANVIAYSAAISALSKGQQWEKALMLFREIEKSGGRPSVVTYNATMTALEKGLQWERALDLFDEMKRKKLQVTVVSYGSAISACEKGYQWRQCLDFLDEMTEINIRKNVIIFGAAMSCMEKSCRADIAFQLMDRMKLEGVSPNVHIYNSAISACARCGLWKKGLELFDDMERVGVVRDVVTYNAVLDAVSSQVKLARRLFQDGVEKGFYARVSRLGTQWLELDLHFLSLGGGEIALGWWFEECLVPYLGSHEKLSAVKSIDIVTGYGKTRMRGARQGDDGMRKRVRAMLRFMNVKEIEQPNKGRIHIDKEALMREVESNRGRIRFDIDGYLRFRKEETTANAMPNVPQIRRNRWGELRREEYHDDRKRDYHSDGNNKPRYRDDDYDRYMPKPNEAIRERSMARYYEAQRQRKEKKRHGHGDRDPEDFSRSKHREKEFDRHPQHYGNNTTTNNRRRERSPSREANRRHSSDSPHDNNGGRDRDLESSKRRRTNSMVEYPSEDNHSTRCKKRHDGRGYATQNANDDGHGSYPNEDYKGRKDMNNHDDNPRNHRDANHDRNRSNSHGMRHDETAPPQARKSFDEYTTKNESRYSRQESSKKPQCRMDQDNYNRYGPGESVSKNSQDFRHASGPQDFQRSRSGELSPSKRRSGQESTTTHFKKPQNYDRNGDSTSTDRRLGRDRYGPSQQSMSTQAVSYDRSSRQEGRIQSDSPFVRENHSAGRGKGKYDHYGPS